VSTLTRMAVVEDGLANWPTVAGGELRSMPGWPLVAVVVELVPDNAYSVTPPITITATAMPAHATVLMPSSEVSRCNSSR